MENQIKYTIKVTRDDSDHRVQLSYKTTGADHSKYIKEIDRRLDMDDIWAWASVEIVASFKGVEGSDHLGGCSYINKDDFVKNSMYYEDMKATAREELLSKLSEIVSGCASLEGPKQKDNDVKDYVKAGGVVCPVCGSESVEGDGLEVDAGTATQEVNCTECKATWEDRYTLTSYEDLEEPDIDKLGKECLQGFLEVLYVGELSALKKAIEDDETAVNEDWNNFTDGMCKDGDISDYAYNELDSVETYFKLSFVVFGCGPQGSTPFLQ